MRTLLLSAAVLGAVGVACAAPPQSGTIKEIQKETESGPSVLVQLGSGSGIRVGQTVEVQRDGRAIGYGSVVKVFKDLSVVSVGTIVTGSGALRVGDKVVFLDSGFTPSKLRRAKPATAERGPEPARAPDEPRGKVVGVRGRVVLFDFGRSAGLRVGHEVALRDASGQVGVASVEMVAEQSAGGMLQEGKARVGLEAISLGRPAANSIDFVALDFLGVVANLEHRTPHRAACHVGVPVRRVLPGSPAQKAGIAKGDRLISVGGAVVRDIRGVQERIQARRADSVRVMLIRGDLVLTADVDFSR